MNKTLKTGWSKQNPRPVGELGHFTDKKLPMNKTQEAATGAGTPPRRTEAEVCAMEEQATLNDFPSAAGNNQTGIQQSGVSGKWQPVTGARTAEREKWIDSDVYPNRRKCLECGTLVVKSKVSRHDCWSSRLSQQYPKSLTLKLRA